MWVMFYNKTYNLGKENLDCLDNFLELKLLPHFRNTVENKSSEGLILFLLFFLHQDIEGLPIQKKKDTISLCHTS